MRLLNLDGEDAPNEYYIFVDQLNPMTAHNLRFTGQFSSGAVNSVSVEGSFLDKYIEGTANYLPFELIECDLKSPSPYFLTAINNYRVEIDAERYRKNNHPQYPSRMSALYAFGDYENCLRAKEKHGWNIESVKRFKLKEWEHTRVVRVNMEYVSLARYAYRISMMEDISRLWQGYWTGEEDLKIELPTADCGRKTYSSGTIWEYLIEGVVEEIK